MQPQKPVIIAFEGIDGAGKSIQAQLLKDSIKGSKLVKFPIYDTRVGQEIHKLLCKKIISSREHIMLTCLNVINQMEHSHILRDFNGVIILDRYIESNLAYANARGFTQDFLDLLKETYSARGSGLPKPDLTILLDIPVELSFKRRPLRKDALEKNSVLQERVRSAYLDMIAKNEAGWHLIKYCGGGDSNSSSQKFDDDINKIHESIVKVCKLKFPTLYYC